MTDEKAIFLAQESLKEAQLKVCQLLFDHAKPAIETTTTNKATDQKSKNEAVTLHITGPRRSGCSTAIAHTITKMAFFATMNGKALRAFVPCLSEINQRMMVDTIARTTPCKYSETDNGIKIEIGQSWILVPCISPNKSAAWIRQCTFSDKFNLVVLDQAFLWPIGFVSKVLENRASGSRTCLVSTGGQVPNWLDRLGPYKSVAFVHELDGNGSPLPRFKWIDTKDLQN